ncbi:hypothetical protein ACFXPW_28310 [Streptomyces goshikiensis]|uniref:hypothetical protein n=1 Tax=Streptomyces goshikiensis TaxID=1942 RepID=UPI00367972E7
MVDASGRSSRTPAWLREFGLSAAAVRTVDPAYERARLPERFVVLGDAAAAYNPVYGDGMAVAAQSAVALRDTVRALG